MGKNELKPVNPQRVATAWNRTFPRHREKADMMTLLSCMGHEEAN